MAVCLQGGAEFGSRARGMDVRVLARAGAGPVVVTALAGARGPEYETATANGVRYYRSMGASEVLGAPDARVDDEGAYQACRGARLLVLPGGSPARLLEALSATSVGRAVREVLAGGGSVSGSSAGAMVLGAWTVLPDGGRIEIAEGLGVVPWAVVIPHYRVGSPWLAPLRDELAGRGVGDELAILGLPEQSGVLVEGREMEALGSSSSHVVAAGSGVAYDLGPLSNATWPAPSGERRTGE